jgi:hypothetical protein
MAKKTYNTGDVKINCAERPDAGDTDWSLCMGFPIGGGYSRQSCPTWHYGGMYSPWIHAVKASQGECVLSSKDYFSEVVIFLERRMKSVFNKLSLHSWIALLTSL